MKFGGALLCSVLFLCGAGSLEVVKQWNLLNFDFPPYDYNYVNMYKPENNVPTGLEITEDRLFIAVPRLRAGVAATLSVVPRTRFLEDSPVLSAYPDWSWHGAARGDLNCTGLISVYRIRKDSCNRLWVVDSGIMTSIDDFTRVCPPKIVIFDLRTNVAVRVIQLPRQVLRPSSLLTNIVIDEATTGGSCDAATVYMTDTAAPGLVMYNSAKDTSWRVMHPSMFPDPDFNEYNINGERFSLMDGVVGMALSVASRVLYYQPLATDRVFSVPVEALQKGPLAENEQLPVTFVGRKSSQGLGLAVDSSTDELIFSPMTETAVSVWHPQTNKQRVIAQDSNRLQFAAEVRYSELDGSIWVLSSRFQKFFLRNVSPHEINLRIVRIPRAGSAQPVRPFDLRNDLYY